MVKLINNLDKIAALAGITAGIALSLVLKEARYSEFGITLILACIVYLVISWKGVSITLPSFRFQMSYKRYILLSIAFLVLFAGSILVISFHSEPYVRPVIHFVLISALASLLAFEVMHLPEKGGYIYFTLLKIILLALSLQWIPQVMFPSLNGIDVWEHAQAVRQMLMEGHIPPDYVYAKLPLMPLALGAASLVTGLGYKFSGLLSIGVFYLATVPFTFLIAKHLFNFRIGLLSALMVSMANWYIHNSLWAMPNTMGIALVIFLTYLVYTKVMSTKFTALILSTIAITVLTHALASFAIFLILAFTWLGQEFYRLFYHARSQLAGILLVCLSSLLPLVYWMYISGHTRHIYYAIKYAFQMEQGAPAPLVSQFVIPTGYTEMLLNRTGLLLFYFLAIVGILAVLSNRLSNPYRFCFLMAGGITTFTAFLGGPLGRGDLLPDRFLAYSQILLATFTALGILAIVNLLKHNVGSYVALVLLVASFCFMQITSPHANRESPIYSTNTAYRTSFTQSELQAAETISSVYEGKIMVDMPYNHTFDVELELLRESPGSYLIHKDFKEFNGLVVVREYCTKYVFYGPLKLDYDLQQLLEQQGFSLIYDSGTVSAFLPLGRLPPER